MTTAKRSSWNITVGLDENIYLNNRSRTLLRFSKKVSVNIGELFDQLESRGIPISYTESLDEVYFTVLPKMLGDYLLGRIRISCTQLAKETLARTFLHEIAHLIDDAEDISGTTGLAKEKRYKAKHIPDSYARKDIGEYVAVGFEIFYFGTREEKSTMRKKNPKLFNAIRAVHKKYIDR